MTSKKITNQSDKYKNQASPRVVVIGVGNLLMRDEGIGIHAVQALQAIDLPPDVKLIDGGTSPYLIAYMRAGDKIIIIDAAKAGGEPGAIYHFKPEDILVEKQFLYSAHELGVVENLKLMEMSGHRPVEVIIIGIEMAVIGWGMELSPVLKQRLPMIVEVVLKEMGLGRTP